jgi:protein O-GlcNAc transferase
MATEGTLRGFVRAACAVVSAAACSSCTHQVQTAQSSIPVPAVNAVMAREVKGAADAGEGDIDLRMLRQRLAANAKDPDARIALAHYYAERNLPDLALEHYRLAAAQFPDSVPVALALAKSLRELGEPSEALKTLHEFADRQPRGSWEVLSLAGILEDEQGRLADAEKSHRAALELAPDQSALHNNLGYNLLSQKKTDAAIAEFRRAIDLEPKSEIAHNNLATALARSGSGSEEALAEWSRTANPAQAHNNLAAVLIEQGRYREARSELATALGLQPNLSSALANLKLVSELDGKPAAVSIKRRASLWARIFGRRSAQPTGAAPSDTAGATGANTTADTTVKK